MSVRDYFEYEQEISQTPPSAARATALRRCFEAAYLSRPVKFGLPALRLPSGLVP